MNVAILGFGSQGVSSLEYWNTPENTVTICDNNDQLEAPEGIATKLGVSYLQKLDEFDLIVRSPSVHPRAIVEANSAAILQKVTTNTNEFMRVCPTRNIIGVTGTKGKGTTSGLLTQMLRELGHTVHLGGNIGTPPLEMLQYPIQPDDWVVLELANFQLIDINYSPHIALCLMIQPEHQDWHSNMEEYVEAKRRLFTHQSDNDVAIYYAPDERSKYIADASNGHKIPYFARTGAYVKDDSVVIDNTVICDVNEIRLLGRHNWQNVCAAVTAIWQITQDVAAIRQAIISFEGFPYRLEFIREIDGVKYYNDSFGTTPETAIVAIEAFSEPKVLALGGSDKGVPFKELAMAVKRGNVRSVITIGDTGPTIARELTEIGFENIVTGLDSMEAIVKQIRDLAKPGDIALLSTGCASFGMFNNYVDRGDQFNVAVRALA